MIRKLADSKHPVGILSLGTFNNFALALGLPPGLDEQIKVLKTGRARAITLGRVNGNVFFEACAIGLFGETIALGEAAKDRMYGSFVTALRDVLSAKRFRYELQGDIAGDGSAMSLVFTNTSSIGARLPVSDARPTATYLEFSVHAGRTKTDIAVRALASALLMKHKEEGAGQVFRFRQLSRHARVHISRVGVTQVERLELRVRGRWPNSQKEVIAPHVSDEHPPAEPAAVGEVCIHEEAQRAHQ